MADGGGGSDVNAGECVKLFVGQVPKSMTEAQLLAMFREVALVEEVNIIKDKVNKASRGERILSSQIVSASDLVLVS